MVQVLGRLALSVGAFLVGRPRRLCWRASCPIRRCSCWRWSCRVISASGAWLVHIGPVEQRPIDWRILGGGIAFGAFVVAMALGNVAYNQEIVFLVSMAVVIAMLRHVVGEVDAATQRKIFFAGADHLRLPRDARRRLGLHVVHDRRAEIRRDVPGHAGADRNGRSRSRACGCSPTRSRGSRWRACCCG